MLRLYPACAVRHARSSTGNFPAVAASLGHEDHRAPCPPGRLGRARRVRLGLVVRRRSTAGSGASGSAGMGTAPSGVVASAKKAKVGSVIVDAQGRTLYRFTAEAQGLPVCTGACVGTWPPALASTRLGPARARRDGQASRRRQAPADLRRPSAVSLRRRRVEGRRQWRGRGRPVVRAQGRRRRRLELEPPSRPAGRAATVTDRRTCHLCHIA